MQIENIAVSVLKGISAVKTAVKGKEVKIRGCQILNLYKYSMVGRICLYIKQIMVVPIVM